MPANFVEINYDTLQVRKTRVVAFFTDLEEKLVAIGAPNTSHLDITFDGSKVNRISDGIQISTLPPSDILEYYTQGLGLMKLAINGQLYA